MRMDEITINIPITIDLDGVKPRVTAIKNIDATTFSKEYTFLQQETVTESIPLQINIESYEVYVEYVEAGPDQIWIS